MDRFRSEKEVKVLFECDYCGGYIYKGDEYYLIDDDVTHISCFEAYAHERLGPVRKDAYNEE